MRKNIRIVRNLAAPIITEDKETRNFVSKMQKCYIRGDTFFEYKGKRYKVPQRFYLETNNAEGEIARIPLEELYKKEEAEETVLPEVPSHEIEDEQERLLPLNDFNDDTYPNTD